MTQLKDRIRSSSHC